MGESMGTRAGAASVSCRIGKHHVGYVSESGARIFRAAALSPQWKPWVTSSTVRSEEHTSELQSHVNLVCRLLLEKKKIIKPTRDLIDDELKMRNLNVFKTFLSNCVITLVSSSYCELWFRCPDSAANIHINTY